MSAPQARRGTKQTPVSKEMRELVARIEAAGGRVEKCRRGSHMKVFNQDGRYVATIGGTPGDYRSRRNDLAAIRRGGLTI